MNPGSGKHFNLKPCPVQLFGATAKHTAGHIHIGAIAAGDNEKSTPCTWCHLGRVHANLKVAENAIIWPQPGSPCHSATCMPCIYASLWKHFHLHISSDTC